ncbi:MAE_28990/MAE_18760 family HEPN-like nuclease [Kocuria sp. SM24M-10]|uniref:MAE_28990/MAE_18760 family HEPN-like nuclease n=1 Tax=Kocuria sp. SM24M-10 TaxID=1660349 RepID=UPI001364C6F7
MAYSNLEGCLHTAGESLDGIRQALLDISSGKVKGGAAEALHASTYVLISATLERTLKESLTALVNEINATRTPLIQVRPSLFSLICDSQFVSIANSGAHESLNRRVDLTLQFSSHDQCLLNESILPLDGRTIRKKHFDPIWRVFGFSNNSLDLPRHQFTLETVANFRNDVAHGDASLAEVAGRQTVEDTLRYVDEIEAVLLHFYSTAEDYLLKSLYVR